MFLASSIFDIINFTILDAIDIVLVALLLLYFYKLMKESGSQNVFYGILIFIFIWLCVSFVFKMKLLGSIFDNLMSVGLIAVIVIFQEEIRRLFRSIGSQGHLKVLSKLIKRKGDSEEVNDSYIPLVLACKNMSQQKVGALIIVERNDSLDEYAKSGSVVDGNLNQRLIETIFFKNSPLHDGAMVISNGRVAAAACILPVSNSQDVPGRLGLRHRSALGVSERTDALVIIVSEETGYISIAQNGRLRINVSIHELEKVLRSNN